MFKRITITVITIIAISSPLFGQQLSLNEAIDLALNNNNKIKQYEEKLSQKEYENASAWGNFLPSVDLQGSYNHLNDPLQYDLNDLRDGLITMNASSQLEIANLGNIISTGAALSDEMRSALYSQITSRLDDLFPSMLLEFKNQNYYSASFIGVQPLFMGGKLIAAKKYASAEESSARYELNKTQNEIVVETINNYNRVLLCKEIVTTCEKVLDGIKLHRTDAKKLFQQGLIANYHLLRAEVAVAEAERALSDARNNLEIVTLAFKNVVGLKDEDEIILSDQLTYKNFEADLTDLRINASERQPIMKIVEQKKISADQNFNIKRSEFLPQVAAFGKYELYPEYLSAMEPRWAVGVQLKVNLFKGFKKYAELQSADHLRNEVEFIEKEVSDKIDLWVNKSYRDVVNNQTRYKKLDANIALAQENLKQNSKRFKSGLSTSLEVIDAQLSLQKIEIDRLITLYNYYESLSDLYLAEGDPLNLLTILKNSEK